MRQFLDDREHSAAVPTYLTPKQRGELYEAGLAAFAAAGGAPQPYGELDQWPNDRKPMRFMRTPGRR